MVLAYSGSTVIHFAAGRRSSPSPPKRNGAQKSGRLNPDRAPRMEYLRAEHPWACVSGDGGMGLVVTDGVYSIRGAHRREGPPKGGAWNGVG